ncbi:hypothetical protein KQI84_01655 [bacterium]|nr:hypothetical protein [bacterium]
MILPLPGRRRRRAVAKKSDSKAPKRLVVLVPPLLNPSLIMQLLAWRLRRAGYRTRVFSYASYRRDIPDNAELLAAYLRQLGEDDIDVVTFSLGGILLRWAVNHHEMPRLGSVVQIGAPNRGAFMADWLWSKTGPFFPLIWGRAAMQLRRGTAGLCERAGQFPRATRLGIIAGGISHSKGFNPLIPGDNDFTVGVQETILPGMRDFALVRARHTQLVLLKRTADLTRQFLQTGRFRTGGRATH